MKIKKGFKLRDVCGEQIIVAEGRENIDFSKIISMNESSALLWKSVDGTDFDETVLAGILTDNYDVDEAQALADSRALIDQWQKVGIVED